jgi:Ni/Fe-hydrogenase subunit HybB-like protein
MIARIKSEITLWRVIVAVIFATGIHATYIRFFEGFRASTNLSDQMPWSLWVGLGTLCGVGLSAAGFGISAAVYLLGMERYRPILRAAILISFLGYMTVCVGYLYEIGLPWRFWHPIVMWNHRSVLFDVCVCIMTYTTVLTFEFAPAVIEKLPWQRFREIVLRYHHKILIGVVLAGVLLSSMHQSYLGGLYLIASGKLHPLWYSPYMHAMFYLSAIPAGLALTVMAIYLCMRSLNVRIDFSILSDCGRMIQLLLVVFAFFKVLDLTANQAFGYAFQRTSEAGYFWLEVFMFLVIPITLLSFEKVRTNPQ